MKLHSFTRNLYRMRADGWTAEVDNIGQFRLLHPSGIVYALFDPVAALCFYRTQKYFKPSDFQYAAKEINMDPEVAELIAMASDEYRWSLKNNAYRDTAKLREKLFNIFELPWDHI